MKQRKAKVIKAWGLLRPKEQTLVAHWTSIGDGKEAVSPSIFLRRSHAKGRSECWPNSRENMEIVRVEIKVITP